MGAQIQKGKGVGKPTVPTSRPSPMAAGVAVAVNAAGGAAVGLFAWVLFGILATKVAPGLASTLKTELFGPAVAPWCIPFVGLFAAGFGGTAIAERAGLAALTVAFVTGAVVLVAGPSGLSALAALAGGLVGTALVALLSEPGVELRLRRKPVRRAALLVGLVWLVAILIGAAVISARQAGGASPT